MVVLSLMSKIARSYEINYFYDFSLQLANFVEFAKIAKTTLAQLFFGSVLRNLQSAAFLCGAN